MEQIQQLKKVAMTGAAAKRAVVELKKNAALEKENAEMQKKIPSTMDRLLEKKNLELLETRNFNLRQENKELKEALEEERSFSDRLLEESTVYWICWSVTCRSSFFTSSIRREICCRSIRLIGRKNSTREVIPGAI